MENRTLKRTSWIIAGIIILSVIILLPMSSQAQKYWIGGVDDLWSTGGNWDPSGVPAPADDAYIQNSDAVTFDYNYYTSSPLGSLTIDWGSQLSQSTGVLSITGNSIIGAVDEGYFVQDGGTHNVGTDLILARDIYSNGYYELNAGNLKVTGQSIIGAGDYGEFDHYGGSHMVTGNLILGKESSGYGSYQMVGDPTTSILAVGGSTIVGYNGGG